MCGRATGLCVPKLDIPYQMKVLQAFISFQKEDTGRYANRAECVHRGAGILIEPSGYNLESKYCRRDGRYY